MQRRSERTVLNSESPNFADVYRLSENPLAILHPRTRRSRGRQIQQPMAPRQRARAREIYADRPFARSIGRSNRARNG